MSNLSRLLQLASPMLPIGAYSYSQGLEWAIESADVKDLETAKNWVGDVLQLYIGQFELPILLRLYAGWAEQDVKALKHWDSLYHAGRDSAETQAESIQMAYSLARLQKELQAWTDDALAIYDEVSPQSFPTVYALSALCWDISADDMLHAYAWSWLENQASAAMKTVPLGQVAGQKIMTELADLIPGCIDAAKALATTEISNFCPALTIASCRHETQYSRLFRS